MNYYCYATTTDQEGLDAIKQELAGGINPMIIKKRLAKEIVSLYHGAQAAAEAQEAFEKLFSHKEVPEDIPEFETSEKQYKVVKLMLDSGLCSGSGEAKRLIQGGGVSWDGQKVSSYEAELALTEGGVLKVGKRKFVRIKLQ